MAERRAAAAGAVRLEVLPVFVAGREGIIERVENAAAGEHEVPRLAAIGVIVAAEEAGFVVGDRFVEAVVQRDSVGIGVVKIDDVHAGLSLRIDATKLE